MAKSPTNGMDIDETSKQDKDNISSDLTVTTGKRTISKVNKTNVYEGLNGIKINMLKIKPKTRQPPQQKDEVKPAGHCD